MKHSNDIWIPTGIHDLDEIVHDALSIERQA